MTQWVQITIDTTKEAIDWVSTLLAATAYAGEIYVSRYDSAGSEASERSAPASPWDFTLQLYVVHDQQAHSLIEDTIRQLSPLHRTGLIAELQTSLVEQKPTLLDPETTLIHQVGQFVILSPGAAYQANAKQVPLTLPPSMAFGSGLHPATVLSLRLLERHVVAEMKTLDLGSGTGILSVAMAKLGATVLALDNDPIAVQATQKTVDQNAVQGQVTVQEGSLGQGSNLGHWMNLVPLESVPTVNPRSEFDLIVANIQARVHIALATDFRNALNLTNPDSGLLITAGFTTDYEEDVSLALATAGFGVVDRETMGEWVALTHHLARTEA